jgi:hypothetical protein
MATGPKKDYNVMARFWLPAAEQRDFNLVFEPSQYISKDQLLEAVKTAMILIVPPIPYELNGEGESRKAGLKQFSEHYLGLYSIWMSEDDIKKARGYAGAALPRDIPTEAQAKEADDMLKLKNLKLRRTTATTVVSASKISRASGMRKTTDDQLTIMGKSATDVSCCDLLQLTESYLTIDLFCSVRQTFLGSEKQRQNRSMTSNASPVYPAHLYVSL